MPSATVVAKETVAGMSIGGKDMGKDTDKKPLKIIICGAGIGGLTAAIMLRQNGHHVEIFEQSKFAGGVGAAFSMAPNVTKLISRIGIDLEGIGAVDFKYARSYNGAAELKQEYIVDEAEHEHPWVALYRPDIQSALLQKATSTIDAGIPVKLYLRTKVASVDTETATVTLSDGEMHKADVIIGADGVHSVLRPLVAPSTPDPTPAEKCVFRALIPVNQALSDPVTKPFVGLDSDGNSKGKLMGGVDIYSHADKILVLYACHGGEWINASVFHTAAETRLTGKEGWNHAASIPELCAPFQEMHPGLVRLLSMSLPETVNYWRIQDLRELGTWVNGNVALLGDAAHPFLPFVGQGAGQAIEDAAALAVCLPLGVSKEEVNTRLKLYETCRWERATKVQRSARMNGHDLEEGDVVSLTEVRHHHQYDSQTHAVEVVQRFFEGQQQRGRKQ